MESERKEELGKTKFGETGMIGSNQWRGFGRNVVSSLGLGHQS